MSKQQAWPERLKAHIDTRAIVAGVITTIIVLVMTALTGLADGVWKAGEDVLQEKVRVWQALAASVVVLLMAGVAIAPKLRGQRGEAKGITPTEVSKFDVLWPTRGVTNPSISFKKPYRFQAGKPMCPKDRTPLGWALSDDDREIIVVALPDDDWGRIKADSMLFRCFRCNTRYDLRKYRYGMARAREIVEEIALGEYRMSMEAARTRKRG
jgi:hypothetical protein